MKLYYCTCTHSQSFSNFFVSLQGLPICDDGGPSLPSRCLSSLAAASVSFVLGGEGPCMQLSTATRCLNRRSTQFKPCLQRIGEANCVEVHPRTKTIHRCCHHCHAAAAAAAVAVGVGLKFADDVNFVVGMHRATSRATAGGWCGQS